MLVSAKKGLYAHWISANYKSLPNGLRIYATILFWLLLNILEMRFAHLHQNYRALVSKSTRNSRKKHYNSLMTMKFSKIFMFSIFAIFLFTVTLSSGESSDSEETHGIHVASWNWDHVGVFITITAFIVFSGLAKVGRFYMFILFVILWFKYYIMKILLISTLYKFCLFCSISSRIFLILQTTRVLVSMIQYLVYDYELFIKYIQSNICYFIFSLLILVGICMGAVIYL